MSINLAEFKNYPINQIVQLVCSDKFDKDYLVSIYNYDVTHDTSLISDIFSAVDLIEDGIQLLDIVKGKVSANLFNMLIHNHYDQETCKPTLHISFSKHLIYTCYLKFGIKACYELIAKYYDKNSMYLVTSIYQDVTIVHLEHYKTNEKYINILKRIN